MATGWNDPFPRWNLHPPLKTNTFYKACVKYGVAGTQTSALPLGYSAGKRRERESQFSWQWFLLVETARKIDPNGRCAGSNVSRAVEMLPGAVSSATDLALSTM